MIPLFRPACSGLRPEPRGGFAPATPLKSKTKTFLRRKNDSFIRSILALPLVGTEHDTSKGD
jgi:hypothetical protein